MKTICLPIKLKTCQYNIFINQQAFDFSSVSNKLKNRKIAIISNQTVAPLYLESLQAALTPYNQQLFSLNLKDGEEYKTVASWHCILDFLAENNFTRNDLLISLGGGVICDMTGFAAATWMRGIDFIQVPTSLLAQVDASVGGKTGVNHTHGKNLIGAFHQPQAVIINTSTLKTLPLREFKSGLGETLKYGYINQAPFIKWLDRNSSAILAQDMPILTEVIAKCCQFKAEIVQQDEKESGIRALLNLGHTFAHAIETHSNYQLYTHGEAVAIGMVMAAELSVILNIASNNLRKELEKNLQDFQLLTKLPKEIDTVALVELMRLDKKVLANKHRLILIKKIGETEIHTDVCEKDILQAIKNCQ